MKFLLTGLNHRNAPVELREQVAISADELPAALQALRAWPHVQEAMILSTCNRVELLVAYTGEAPDLPGFLVERFPVPASVLGAHLYQHRDAEAVRHLFRVGASLDSMVVGEPQILGQVKEAFAAARNRGVVGRELERLLQSTFSLAKRVRTETAIGSSSVSIASVAVDLALKIFGSLAGKKVLLVGAGKMGELAVRHLLRQGASAITVCNRTEARAEKLAQSFGGSVMPYGDLLERAGESDIVITSTGAHAFVFHREDGHRYVQKRRWRPMFFIDIAVPRDVDPEMNRVDGVFLYDIDDLQGVAATNLADRSREAMPRRAAGGAGGARILTGGADARRSAGAGRAPGQRGGHAAGGAEAGRGAARVAHASAAGGGRSADPRAGQQVSARAIAGAACRGTGWRWRTAECVARDLPAAGRAARRTGCTA